MAEQQQMKCEERKGRRQRRGARWAVNAGRAWCIHCACIHCLHRTPSAARCATIICRLRPLQGSHRGLGNRIAHSVLAVGAVAIGHAIATVGIAVCRGGVGVAAPPAAAAAAVEPPPRLAGPLAAVRTGVL